MCLVKDVVVMTTIVREINKGVMGTKKEKAWSPSGFWFQERNTVMGIKRNSMESTLSFL